MNTFKCHFFIFRQLSLLAFALLFISASTVFAQKYLPQQERISKHIRVLSADKMKGRGTGSPESEKAARYVQKEFKKLKLQPKGTEGYYQSFEAKVRRVVVADSIRQSKNVIGFLDNNAPYTIVIGAHYDHLGMGKQGSSKAASPEGQIHNGADDNASGVAGMLELARYFTLNGVQEPMNFLFMAFGAEELGLVGSRHFVNHPTIPLASIHFMSNMDMIGRYNADRGVGIGGFGTTADWPKVFENVTSEIKFFTDNAGDGGSDHAAFYRKQIPVLFFHTGGHDDYHMPTDDAEKINAKAEKYILELHIALIEKAMQLSKFQFKEVN
jgi:Zn-dependent M28 family amino/carboxypeptidase